MKMNDDAKRRLFRVAAAQHRGEGHDLLLAAALFAGLLVVTLRAHTLDDVLAVELLLHATERTINGLVFADFDFDGHVVRQVGERKKTTNRQNKFSSVNRIFPFEKNCLPALPLLPCLPPTRISSISTSIRTTVSLTEPAASTV